MLPISAANSQSRYAYKHVYSPRPQKTEKQTMYERAKHRKRLKKQNRVKTTNENCT